MEKDYICLSVKDLAYLIIVLLFAACCSSSKFDIKSEFGVLLQFPYGNGKGEFRDDSVFKITMVKDTSFKAAYIITLIPSNPERRKIQVASMHLDTFIDANIQFIFYPSEI